MATTPADRAREPIEETHVDFHQDYLQKRPLVSSVQDCVSGTRKKIRVAREVNAYIENQRRRHFLQVRRCFDRLDIGDLHPPLSVLSLFLNDSHTNSSDISQGCRTKADRQHVEHGARRAIYVHATRQSTFSLHHRFPKTSVDRQRENRVFFLLTAHPPRHPGQPERPRDKAQDVQKHTTLP